jgi:hypothetical protein
MNRITKAALCFSLVEIGVFVWPHVAAAGKPPSAPVVVTFLSGDVIAEPQPLGGPFTAGNIVGGPFTATIDFLKYIPYICPDSPAGGQAVLEFLQTQNPITYDSLTVSVSKKGVLYSGLYFETTIDGVSYTIFMNVFLSGTTVSTPTLDTMHWSEGRFAVMSKTKGYDLLVVAGGAVELDFTMTK